MPVQITINGENAAQAIEEFVTLSAAFGGATPSDAPVKEEVKPRQRKAHETKKEESKVETEQDSAPDEGAVDSQPNEDEDIPTVVELRAKAQEVGKDPKRKPEIKKLLGEFESAAISDVPEEKRKAFMVALEAL
ncbi:hypothetical protein AWU65_20300 [Paenibacillus glucanolyticus]|uniref:Uncharacterized protein n=1 Tax=Paenibacillus glucanolyticus TaxID=59843 RepID=A0A163LG24_9BACL|nr:hypothetical protein [Paenibacillus glucanolyticus]KZS48100.1 hypothetical protein AWU65_20300 [Paenibacillus glucanolyticus]